MNKTIIILLIGLFMAPMTMATDRAGQSDSVTMANFITAIYGQMLPRMSAAQQVKYLDTTSIRNVVNRVTRDISERIGDAVERWDTLVTTKKQIAYTLNKDCAEVEGVLFSNHHDSTKIGLEPIQPGDIGKRTMGSDPQPKYYAVWGQGSNKTIYLDPVNNASDTLFVLYRARANSMAADTTTTNVRVKYFEQTINESIIILTFGRSEQLLVDARNAAKDNLSYLLNSKAQPASIMPAGMK